MHTQISELMDNAEDGAEIFGDKGSKALLKELN